MMEVYQFCERWYPTCR